MIFSCIIPIYNEWPRVLKVLEAVFWCEDISEVIVVDDGSTDETWKIINNINNTKLQKFRFEKNSWKTSAVLFWVEKTKGDYIVLIDSDLLYLTSQHISQLIKPVKDKKVAITISIRQNSLSIYKLLGTDFVSGERVLPTIILKDKAFFSEIPSFWLEVKINEKIIDGKYTFMNIFLQWVVSPRKTTKMWFFQGMKGDMRMVREIISVVSLQTILYQLWYFSVNRKR
jgi:glycosyltransferase involved in cell wall biosynthesis